MIISRSTYPKLNTLREYYYLGRKIYPRNKMAPIYCYSMGEEFKYDLKNIPPNNFWSDRQIVWRKFPFQKIMYTPGQNGVQYTFWKTAKRNRESVL